jgi:PIN domain nuclease of toxin-antitoxin system
MTMPRSILLDTCAALWTVAGILPQKAADALNEAYRSGLPTYVSPITAWEIGILARKGRFRSPLTPHRWFEVLMSLPGAALAEMPPRLLLDASFLPGKFHLDPGDQIIASTAREYGFTVMTRDRALLDYAAQGYLSAVAC